MMISKISTGRFFIFIAIATVFCFVPKISSAALINATGLLGHVDVNGNLDYATSSANNGSSTPNAQGFNRAAGNVLDTVNHRFFCRGDKQQTHFGISIRRE